MSKQGPAVSPERVVITASTSEAYAFLFKLLCDPGDEVLLPVPSYPLFEHLCRLEHVSVRPYALAYDGRFHVELGALEKAVTARTRAVVAVHPNNPTGNYLDRDELDRIAALERPLISDEVFAPYRLIDDPDPVRSAREIRDTLCFSLHGLSKLTALPQLKLSWICIDGPDALVSEALGRLEIIADAYLSVATPVQLALVEILAQAPAVSARVLARAKGNLKSLQDACRGTSISVLDAEGGWYAVLRLPALMDDEAWALYLLRDSHVLVQPGYFYDFEGGPYLVLSLITPEAELVQGVSRLLETVATAAIRS
jgi:alanine-synthesizing transaminase